MKRFVNVLLLIFLLNGYTLKVFSQNEANVWWFGTNSGLDFNGVGGPFYIQNKPINTYEGSSTICDPVTGTLIFATDGQTVWYPNGTTVPGGTGLRGASSSAQSALIVPNPANANQWYIFTSNVDPGTGTPYGTNYYTVTRVGVNLSVGGVTNLLGVAASTEQLCALGDGAGGYWVVTHATDGTLGGAGAGSNAFKSFHVTNAGVVNTTAVTSNAGFSMKYYQGNMKANTCQTQIAATYLLSSGAATEVYNFNNATGQVTGVACSVTGLANPYGLEFSPDDQFLYHATLGGTCYQLNISTCVNSNTGWAFIPNGSTRFGQMQLGPDGKIYVTNECTAASCYIGVIDAPNNPFASAGWINNAITVPVPMTNGYPQLGLPTFSRTFISGVLNVLPGSGTYCVNTDIPLSYTFSGPVTSQTWTVSPGAGWSYTSGSSTSASPTIRFTANNTYTVTLDVVSCSRTYTKVMTFTIISPINATGTVSCSGNNLVFDNPAVDPNEPKYVWYKNSVSTANIIGIGTPFTYPVGGNTAMPTQICVQVASSATSPSSGSNSIASALTLTGAANGSPYISNNISVLSDNLVLKSFDIKFWVCPGATVGVNIKDGGGTSVFNQNVPISCSVGSIITVPINTTLLKGNNYTITLTGGQYYRNSWSSTTNAGEITYGPEAFAGVTSIANIQYDYKNFAVTTTCSTPTCIPVGCTLPVAWVSTSAKRENDHVVVDWAVASQTNNQRFEVQRSLDGIHFETVGVVQGAGTKKSYSEYEFVDFTSEQGQLYYRIVQYDFDGMSSTSGIASVGPARSMHQFVLYPNPTNGEVTLTLLSSEEESGQMIVSVYNSIGQEVYGAALHATALSTGLTVDLSTLSQGAYLVKVTTNKGEWIEHLIKK